MKRRFISSALVTVAAFAGLVPVAFLHATAPNTTPTETSVPFVVQFPTCEHPGAVTCVVTDECGSRQWDNGDGSGGISIVDCVRVWPTLPGFNNEPTTTSG